MTIVSKQLGVVAYNCSTPGILLFNEKTYCMKWSMFASSTGLHQIGTGTLIVNQPDSYFNGTYYNTPIYISDKYLYVWPNLEFSMVSTIPYE